MLAFARNPASQSSALARAALPRAINHNYRKLCPRSGHVLTREERDALGSDVARRGPTIRCESCGREVELVVHPATGRSYVYPMHVKACASTFTDPTAVRQRGTP